MKERMGKKKRARGMRVGRSLKREKRERTSRVPTIRQPKTGRKRNNHQKKNPGANRREKKEEAGKQEKPACKY